MSSCPDSHREKPKDAVATKRGRAFRYNLFEAKRISTSITNRNSQPLPSPSRPKLRDETKGETRAKDKYR